ALPTAGLARACLPPARARSPEETLGMAVQPPGWANAARRTTQPDLLSTPKDPMLVRAVTSSPAGTHLWRWAALDKELSDRVLRTDRGARGTGCANPDADGDRPGSLRQDRRRGRDGGGVGSGGGAGAGTARCTPPRGRLRRRARHPRAAGRDRRRRSVCRRGGRGRGPYVPGPERLRDRGA